MRVLTRPSSMTPSAAVFVALLAGVAGVAHAVDFDQRIKAPQARNSESLRMTARTAIQEFADTTLEGREALIRDASKSRRQFDARWTLVHAVESGAPLGDLAEFGISPNDKGEVVIDLGKFPQWDDFDGRVARILSGMQLDELGARLIARGMTEEDLGILKSYVAKNNVELLRRQAQLPVSLTFGKLVRKLDKARQPVPKEVVIDYLYQQDAASASAYRAWFSGLLDALEPRAGRVLLSYFGELKPMAIWGPSDLDAAVRERLTALRSADFEQRARAEAVGGAK